MDVENGTDGSGASLEQPLLSRPPPLRPGNLSLNRGMKDWGPLPDLSGLMAQSVLVTGRIGRLQVSERLMAFTDAVLAIIATSTAVPLWASGTSNFNPIRLVPYITTFLIIARLWEKHCQDFSRVQSVDEWLAQCNTMWIAAISLLPFSFVVLLYPASHNSHVAYVLLWVFTLICVGGTSFLLSRATRRLSGLQPSNRAYKGWQSRDIALSAALLEVGIVVIGISFFARRNHFDILTKDYKEAFRGDNLSGTVGWSIALMFFWVLLACRLNFQVLKCFFGDSSSILFDGRVSRVRVEIFSDAVYSAAATGLMIELLSGLLTGKEEGEADGESGKGTSVWPGLINYIYCFHVVAVLHRSHQNIVAKIPSFKQNLLAINCLVCLAVAFIPTLATILDGTWNHEPAALTAAAAFILGTSLLLLLLLIVALKVAPLEAPKSLADADADSSSLLAEMLGRPLGPGLISGFLQPPGSPVFNASFWQDHSPSSPHHQAPNRLFNAPSCLEGGQVDPTLIKRLQAIRDDYEITSACILPVMACFLTMLTTCLQVADVRSPYAPLPFLLTFFVYSIERHLLRPYAAKQINKIQSELKRKHMKGGANLIRGGSGFGQGGLPSKVNSILPQRRGSLQCVVESDSEDEGSSSSSGKEAFAFRIDSIEEGAEGEGQADGEEEGGEEGKTVRFTFEGIGEDGGGVEEQGTEGRRRVSQQ